jgi:hypothetical protein
MYRILYCGSLCCSHVCSRRVDRTPWPGKYVISSRVRHSSLFVRGVTIIRKKTWSAILINVASTDSLPIFHDKESGKEIKLPYLVLCDPDPDPTYHFWCVSGSWFVLDADSIPDYYLMRKRIQIRLFTLMRIWIRILSSKKRLSSNPGKSNQIGSYSIHFGLSFLNWRGSRSSLLPYAYPDADPDFYLMLIRIRVSKMIQIHNSASRLVLPHSYSCASTCEQAYGKPIKGNTYDCIICKYWCAIPDTSLSLQHQALDDINLIFKNVNILPTGIACSLQCFRNRRCRTTQIYLCIRRKANTRLKHVPTKASSYLSPSIHNRKAVLWNRNRNRRNRNFLP